MSRRAVRLPTAALELLCPVRRLKDGQWWNLDRKSRNRRSVRDWVMGDSQHLLGLRMIWGTRGDGRPFASEPTPPVPACARAVARRGRMRHAARISDPGTTEDRLPRHEEGLPILGVGHYPYGFCITSRGYDVVASAIAAGLAKCRSTTGELGSRRGIVRIECQRGGVRYGACCRSCNDNSGR